jgi:hypothetical protein
MDRMSYIKVIICDGCRKILSYCDTLVYGEDPDKKYRIGLASHMCHDCQMEKYGFIIGEEKE